MSDKVPACVRLQIAMMTNDGGFVKEVLADCMNDMTREALDLATKHPVADLPLVVAAMQTAANAIKTSLSPEGQALADSIMNGTRTVVIDGDELLKQMGEETR